LERRGGFDLWSDADEIHIAEAKEAIRLGEGPGHRRPAAIRFLLPGLM